MAYPKNFFVIRGNHETLECRAYGFKSEESLLEGRRRLAEACLSFNGTLAEGKAYVQLAQRIGSGDGKARLLIDDIRNNIYSAFMVSTKDTKGITKLQSSFTFLPFSILVGRRVLGVHGGLSERTPNLEALANLKRPAGGREGEGLGYHMLWADPLPDKADIYWREEQTEEEWEKVLKVCFSRQRRSLCSRRRRRRTWSERRPSSTATSGSSSGRSRRASTSSCAPIAATSLASSFRPRTVSSPSSGEYSSPPRTERRVPRFEDANPAVWLSIDANLVGVYHSFVEMPPTDTDEMMHNELPLKLTNAEDRKKFCNALYIAPPTHAVYATFNVEHKKVCFEKGGRSLQKWDVELTRHMVVEYVPKTSPFVHFLLPNDQILDVGGQLPVTPDEARRIFESLAKAKVTVNRVWNILPIPESRLPIAERCF